MFKMKKRSYRVFEGLRVATLVSYIGGFIDAYTYNTQDGRFASIQTGNLLYLVIHLVDGHIARAFSYFIPIFFFILGQFFVFFAKKWLINHKWGSIDDSTRNHHSICRFHYHYRGISFLCLSSSRYFQACQRGKLCLLYDDW